MKKYNRHHIGEVYTSNEGYRVEIIDGGSKSSYNTILIDNKYIKEFHFDTIKKGRVKNFYHRVVANTGYIGIGIYNSKKHKKIYHIWHSMITRCYNETTFFKTPTYKKVTVCSEWHNFQNFAKWYEDNYVEGWELDKDILSGGKKIYSPNTCCFLPHKVNTFMVNKKSNNTSGYIGVCYATRDKKWIATIAIDNKNHIIGFFNTPEEASIAYQNARKKEVQKIHKKYKGILADKILKKIH